MTLRAEHLVERLRALASDQGVPGLVAGVLANGRQITAGTGVLDLRSATAATPRTPFPIASVTKVWTATLVMQLADEGLLALDDTLAELLPDETAEPDHALRPVTVRQLLTHSGGMEGDYFADTGDDADALEKYVASCAHLRIIHPPGDVASYCNTGMIVLGRIVEHLTGQTWSRAVGARIFRPLGLRHTFTMPPPTRSPACVGHEGDRDDRRVVEDRHWPRTAGPAGMFWSTPGDLLTFVRQHLAAAEGNRSALGLSRETARSMQAPQVAVPGPGWLLAPDHWGLGWAIFDWTGGQVIGHDGGGPGFSSFLRVVPEAGVAVTVLANVGDSGPALAGLVGDVVAELTGVRPPAPIDPPTVVTEVDISMVVGSYAGSSTQHVVSQTPAGLVMASRPTGEGPVLGSPEPVALRPLDSSGRAFALEPTTELDSWMPVTLAPLRDGREAIHLAGRIAVRQEP